MLSKGRDYYVELGGRYLVNNRCHCVSSSPSSCSSSSSLVLCFLYSCCLKGKDVVWWHLLLPFIVHWQNRGQYSTLMKLNVSLSPSVGLDCQILGLGPLIRLWKQVFSFIGILILKGIGSPPPPPHKSSHIIIIFKVHSSGFGISLHQCYRH